MDGYHDLGVIEPSAQPAPATRPLRKALLVLGMSRSGTSLLTQVLHALGAALPQDLMGPGHGNLLGHFEPHGLVALNDRILGSLDRSWNDPRPIPPRWFRSRAAYECMQDVTAQIGRSFGEASLLVLKDPRLCLLLPLYLDALDGLDIEPLVIVQVRPMQEVVESLGDRDNMHPDLAEFLWLRSVVEAEWQSRDCRRVWVSMADVLANWSATVRRIADGLLLEWPVASIAEPIGGIDSILRPRLQHARSQHLGASASCRAVRGPFSAAAWTAIEHGLAGDETAVRAGFDAVRGALHDLDRLFGPTLASLVTPRPSLPRRAITALRALRQYAAGAVTR